MHLARSPQIWVDGAALAVGAVVAERELDFPAQDFVEVQRIPDAEEAVVGHLVLVLRKATLGLRALPVPGANVAVRGGILDACVHDISRCRHDPHRPGRDQH